MEFIRLQSVGEASPAMIFLPFICRDDSLSMFVHTLDDYGWNSCALQNEDDVSPGARFWLLSDKMFSFSVFVCWMIADGTFILINRG